MGEVEHTQELQVLELAGEKGNVSKLGTRRRQVANLVKETENVSKSSNTNTNTNRGLT